MRWRGMARRLLGRGHPTRSALASITPPTAPGSERLTPGTREYDEHLRGEIAFYAQIYTEGGGQTTLLEPAPSSWEEVQVRQADLIRTATGQDMPGHVTTRLAARPGVRMLSLGSGPGGLEFSFAEGAPQARITCLDINRVLVEIGQQRAGELGRDVQFEVADLNTVVLPPRAFDLVFCHASLHHIIELERLMEQITRTLRPDGELITVDVVTRNGYRMWPETREVVQGLWRTLPERFRINHTAYPEARVDSDIWEMDTSAGSMECIRSEDILPVLAQSFTPTAFVPFLSIGRRFLDPMYGPNYDLAAPLDKALFDWLWELDRHYIVSRQLRPETFFGIYRPKGQGGER